METEAPHSLSRPMIYDFTDYRVYLRAIFEYEKEKENRWSLGRWTKKIGLKSTSSLSKVLNGEREPGIRVLAALEKDLDLGIQEQIYFQNMVLLHSSKTQESVRKHILKQMDVLRNDKGIGSLPLTAFSVISKWYHFTIREMTRLKGFKNNLSWIKEKILFDVSHEDLAHGIENLKTVGLLQETAGGLKVAQGNLRTPDGLGSLAIRNMHCAHLDNAKEALGSVPSESRNYFAATLCFDSKKMEEARTVLRQFSHDFANQFDGDLGDQVYQFQFQFFPVTKKED